MTLGKADFVRLHDQAACNGPDDVALLEGTSAEANARAKVLCHACPVKDLCLERAFEVHSVADAPSGMWAGVGPTALIRMIRMGNTADRRRVIAEHFKSLDQFAALHAKRQKWAARRQGAMA